MPHTATNLLIHFIFGTRRREPSITPAIQADLHAYMGGVVRELDGVALSINGMPDHVHLLVRMPSTRSIADLARVVKTNSSRWVHERWPESKRFAWQSGFGAFSVSESGGQTVREYIRQQQQHHAKRSFEEEFVAFLKKIKIAVDEKYLWS
jgi:REP element-mobilizing transposase RayT